MTNHQENGGVVCHAAVKAGIDRKTAARYLKAHQSPQERRAAAPRRVRRRPDPLAGGLWEMALTWLEPTPELDAKTLFEHLLGEHPEWILAAGGALRTFQRRVKQWRELNGPPKEVHFPQVRHPGESLQFDWTRVKDRDFVVTIAGELFEHLLTHAVLPYSNWEWAVPCRSESGLSLKRGVQEALWELGGMPPRLQTDQSSAATHQISRLGKKRTFNDEYLAFCRHLGFEPRVIRPNSPNQNGDVESAQGHLKRRLRNHLILRGSRDFRNEADYAGFVAKVCRGANALRFARLAEERPFLRPLPARRYPATEEVTAVVSGASVIHVKKTPYSVPSRLIGANVTVQLSDAQIDVFLSGTWILSHSRSPNQIPSIDYRHVIDWLVRKPGAFRNYIYRASLFPDIHFRQAHEQLKAYEEPRSDKRYLRLLQLAAKGSEAAVSNAIAQCMRAGEIPLPERVERQIDTAPSASIIKALQPYSAAAPLRGYDRLVRGLKA
jgi:transposase